VLAAIAAFVIDREFAKASAFALAGAVLTFFGFMHGEAIGFGHSPAVAAAYAFVAVFLAGCAKYAAPAREPVEPPGGPETRTHAA
jgi:AGZA family xanthine/uracil permease-like MFS transporter